MIRGWRFRIGLSQLYLPQPLISLVLKAPITVTLVQFLPAGKRTQEEKVGEEGEGEYSVLRVDTVKYFYTHTAWIACPMALISFTIVSTIISEIGQS